MEVLERLSPQVIPDTNVTLLKSYYLLSLPYGVSNVILLAILKRLVPETKPRILLIILSIDSRLFGLLLLLFKLVILLSKVLNSFLRQ